MLVGYNAAAQKSSGRKLPLLRRCCIISGVETENSGDYLHESKASNASTAARLAGLGSVDYWLNHPGVERYTHPEPGHIGLAAVQVKECVRLGLGDARKLLPDRGADSREIAHECIGIRLDEAMNRQLQRMINATGIILHTNLGRAPLHPVIAKMAIDAACGYTNVEFDISSGARSKRLAGLEHTLADMSGAEAALVVNNCAGALLLILSALAGNPFEDGGFVRGAETEWRQSPNEVVISRGELIQIGGGFRIPRILEASGARLREVGTTNVTTAEDYRRAIGDGTALILKAHASNFSITGYVEHVMTPELAEIAHAAGVPLIEDIGSAVVADERMFPILSGAVPMPYLRAGADLVTFSGDKLLGGPQAGVILGRKEIIKKLRSHPLMRTFRLDKWTGALLSSLLWALGNGRYEYLPVLEMVTRDAAEDKKHAQKIARKIKNVRITIDVTEHKATLGGGTLPGETLESYAIAVKHSRLSADECAKRLRNAVVPIVGTVRYDRLMLSVRTLLAGDEAVLLEAINSL